MGMSKTITSWGISLRALGRSKRTVKTRQDHVWAVANAIGVRPEFLTPELLQSHFAQAAYKTWTRRGYITSLKQWGEYIGRPKLTALVKAPKTPRSVPNPLPEEHLSVLVDYVPVRERLWVLLGAYGGLRAHEVAQLHWGDVLDFGDRTMIRIHGKGDVVDMVPCPAVLADALAQARLERSSAGFLFPTRSRFGHMTPGHLATRVKALASEVGIEMRFHMLRHRYGTAVQRARRDLQLTQQRMRHGSPKSTVGYALVSDDYGHSVVDELPGAGSVLLPGKSSAQLNGIPAQQSNETIIGSPPHNGAIPHIPKEIEDT